MRHRRGERQEREEREESPEQRGERAQESGRVRGEGVRACHGRVCQMDIHSERSWDSDGTANDGTGHLLLANLLLLPPLLAPRTSDDGI